MKNFDVILKTLLLAWVAFAVYSCSSQRNTAANRGLQNLSAHYNIIYNANNYLDTYEDALNEQAKFNYQYFLPIYFAPEINYGEDRSTKEIEEIEKRARTIVAEKNLSNYVDEAYILLGKTSFYKGDFFSAYEYFDYLAHAYAKQRDIFVTAQNWKARCMMELGETKRSLAIIDTLVDSLALVKKPTAAPFATLSNMSLARQDYKKAISYLDTAAKLTDKVSERIRWNYILGQLYEEVKDYSKSLTYYKKIEASNARFEIYFNAKLSHIRVENLMMGGGLNRQQQLAKLLKDDKNADFIDRIYYEMGQDFYAKGDIQQALAMYTTSVRRSTIDQTQKGVSYLQLADINFKDVYDYVAAKNYYDSALSVLPKTYPNYAALQKKATNLEYLSKRYQTIQLQDTLEYIASLPADKRKGALVSYFTPKAVAGDSTQNTSSTGSVSIGPGNGTFYFANAMQVSRGLSDFKRKWGNRKLEDNWRQSNKTTVNDLTAAIQAKSDTLKNSTGEKVVQGQNLEEEKATRYLDSLPLTDATKLQSKNLSVVAYMDIASFYQQILNDKPEAIKAYETLLKKYPNNDHLDIIYYSLYLCYKDIDVQKSNNYKNLILKNYSSSTYAKLILDPNYNLKQNALEEALQSAYNQTFDAFDNNDFSATIAKADAANSRFPGNTLASQFAYLKALGVGHTQPVEPLVNALKAIVKDFPKDSLIKPLAEQHLAYINAHYADFADRPIALPDSNTHELPFASVDKENAEAERTVQNKLALKDYNSKQQKALEAKKMADSVKFEKDKIAQAKAEEEAKKAEEKRLKAEEIARKKTADSLNRAITLEQKNALAKIKQDSLAKMAALKLQAQTEQRRLDSLSALKRQATNKHLADSLARLIAAEKQQNTNRQQTDSAANAQLAQRQAEQAKARLEAMEKAKIALQRQKFVADSLAQIKAKDGLWSNKNSTTFYAVIAINRANENMSSSRFGIGQFNRSVYAYANLQHSLKELPQDQLIYIGDFSSYQDAKKYEMEISRLLSRIMKIPPANYTTFVASKENLDKISDRQTLGSYQNYIKRNEQ